MARYLDVHPRNPQPRLIAQTVARLREGALVVYPTDSCYALGCTTDDPEGPARIRRVRGLDERHHFTLVCADFAQLAEFVHIGNSAFRSMKASTPGPYTFLLRATKDVPRRLQHPRKRTVGVRIPDSPVAQALLRELGGPLVSSTLLLPGHEEAMTDGWAIKEELDHVVDVVLDGGDCGTVPTTVVDLSEDVPEIVRVGAGDVARFT